jgi:hypothetical protein
MLGDGDGSGASLMLPADADAAFGGVPLVGFGVLSRTNSPAASTVLLRTLARIAPAVFLLGSPSALGEGIRIVSILLLRGFCACARKRRRVVS